MCQEDVDVYFLRFSFEHLKNSVNILLHVVTCSYMYITIATKLANQVFIAGVIWCKNKQIKRQFIK